MLFNSFSFLIFFAVVYPLARVLPATAQKRWLLTASLVFYGWWDWRYLGLLLFTTTLDWFIALRIEGTRTDPARKKAWVTASVVSNVGVLFAFKYLGFFASIFNLSLPFAVLLPVGISFYTFQAMAYTLDVYRGHTPACRSYLDFLLFITWFPQLVAGPIERSDHLLPQLTHPTAPTPLQLRDGAWLILGGLVKKVVIADNLALLVSSGFDRGTPSLATAWLAAYAFTFQIYGDFSGYSDIARGLGKWMGVELMENFRRPLFADSPQDLWRRWHRSLSLWLRDYLYLPLGGSRTGHTARNLLLTMLLGGLWHGASWTYVLWGAWHGVGLVAHRYAPAALRAAIPRPLALFATFHFTVLGFAIFRAQGWKELTWITRGLLGLGGWDGVPWGWATLFAALAGPWMAVEAVSHLRGDQPLWVTALPRPVQALAVVALTTALALLGATLGQQFIYFQF